MDSSSLRSRIGARVSVQEEAARARPGFRGRGWIAIAALAMSIATAYELVPASAAAAPPVGPPQNVTAPAVGGNFVAGARLTAHPGTWDGLPATAYRYRWQRCATAAATSCADADAAGPSYRLTAADIDAWLRVIAIATNDDGSGSATSVPVGPVLSAAIVGGGPVRNFAPPVIHGTGRIGELLEASRGSWYAPLGTTFQVAWERCGGSTCRDVGKKGSPLYVPVKADRGESFRVAVTATEPTTLTEVTALSALSPTAVCLDEFCQPNPCEPPYWKPGNGGSVTLFAPATVRPNGADLTWSGTAGQYFRSYEVHRGQMASFEPTSATLLATFADPTVTTYSDTTGVENGRYFYKIVLVSTCERVTSEEQGTHLPVQGQTKKILSPGAAGRATFIYLQRDDSSTACRNSGADPTLMVGTDGSRGYRTLIRFDLSSIPTNAHILDANVFLWTKTGPSTRLTLVAHRLTRDWQEGTGTYAAAQCSGGASWRDAAAGTPWTTAGGDYDTVVDSSYRQDPSSVSPALRNELGLTALARAWVSGDYPNYGFLLKADDESLAAGKTVVFHSDDQGGGMQPALEITYDFEPNDDDGSDTGNDHQTTGYIDDSTAPGRTIDAFDDPNATFEYASQPAGGGDSMQTATVLGCPRTRPPENPGRVAVCFSQAGKNVVFWNDDGRSTIYLDCLGPSKRGGSDLTVGPGYVARYFDTRDPTHHVKIIEGEHRLGIFNQKTRPHFQDAGGLGLFGWHHARGEQNTLTPARGGNQIRDIDGRLCAEDTQVNRWGVVGSRLLNPSKTGHTCRGPEFSDGSTDTGANWWTTLDCVFINSSGVGLLDIEVTFSDQWQEPAQGNGYVMRVTYRWRFRSEGVKMWAAVEPLATTVQNMPDPYCFPTVQPPCNTSHKFLTGTPFVKEPKFLAAVVGAPTPAQGTVYTRMGVFTTNATAWGGQGSMRGEPVTQTNVHTLKTYEPQRSRVRWDFPSAPSAAAAAAMRPLLRNAKYRCPTAGAPKENPACFSVVMREFDAKKILDGGAALQQASSNYWQSGTPDGAGYGLDQWAYDEAKIDIRALQANPDGQCNAKNKNVTDPSTGGTTRSWEWAGYKTPPNTPFTAPELNNNPNPFLWSATLFLGWAGGNGPYDCEPLLRAFPTEGRQMQAPSCPRHASEAGEPTVVCRYGTFAAFGLNDTFKLQAQTGDITG